MSRKKIAVIMDPLEHLKWEKDTTLGLLMSAVNRGHDIYCGLRAYLGVEQQKPFGKFQKLILNSLHAHDYQLEPWVKHDLSEFDVLLMRQDPPFDLEYYYATLILEKAALAGLKVVNHPSAIRNYNEKLSILKFPQWIPDTLISRDLNDLAAAVDTWGKGVIKPLDGMGGFSIFILDAADPNLPVILETVTEQGEKTVMLQRYLPEIKQGDNRILIIGGKPVPYALSRVPQGRDHRGNMARGGKPEGRLLRDVELKIAEELGPILHEQGLYFVGLDVIGDCLTEINVTSPTGLRELTQLYGLDVGELFWEPLGF